MPDERGRKTLRPHRPSACGDMECRDDDGLAACGAVFVVLRGPVSKTGEGAEKQRQVGQRATEWLGEGGMVWYVFVSMC